MGLGNCSSNILFTTLKDADDDSDDDEGDAGGEDATTAPVTTNEAPVPPAVPMAPSNPEPAATDPALATTQRG